MGFSVYEEVGIENLESARAEGGIVVENDLAVRIEKLETEKRIVRVIGILLAMAILVLFLAEHLGTSRSVTAREFLLKDGSGNVVAKLSHDAFGTCLQLMGKANASSATLCTQDEGGASLGLNNHTDESRAFLSTTVPMYEGGIIGPTLEIGRGGAKDMLSATVGIENKIIFGHANLSHSIILSADDNKPTIEISGTNKNRVWAAPIADQTVRK